MRRFKRQHLGGLWRQPDFLKLWTGQTISELGSRITRDGLPLAAVLVLGATPAQMGLLTAVGSVAILLASLPAGVWVDRLRRKPVMIWADVGRAALLLTIPVAAFTGQLGIGLLCAVIALTGVLTVLFEAAYEAYLPSLVARENLLEGNSKLAVSSSLAEVLGPGLAGFLIQAITAPLAILFDSLSFLASVVSLIVIRKPEPPPAAAHERQHVLREMRDGLRFVWHEPHLRALALAGATRSFFGSFIGVLYGLYAIRELGLNAAALGITIAMGGLGSLIRGGLHRARGEPVGRRAHPDPDADRQRRLHVSHSPGRWITAESDRDVDDWPALRRCPAGDLYDHADQPAAERLRPTGCWAVSAPAFNCWSWVSRRWARWWAAGWPKPSGCG